MCYCHGSAVYASPDKTPQYGQSSMAASIAVLVVLWHTIIQWDQMMLKNAKPILVILVLAIILLVIAAVASLIRGDIPNVAGFLAAILILAVDIDRKRRE
jgi:hypothetical protein